MVAALAAVWHVTATPAGRLARKMRRGLAWSLLNSTTLRLGTFLTGIVLARILAPADFGAYAVALTAQTVLINLSDLGLASDLVRHGDLARRGPTVASLGLASAAATFAIMWMTAPALSAFMGAPGATTAVQTMSVVVLASGLSVVPAARMQREFLQGRQFAVDGVNFAVSTAVTLVLAATGTGVMALAVGRVAGQVVATALQFLLVRERPRYGWDPVIGRQALLFGLPLAGANLLSWVLLTVDNAIVGHVSGATALGLYVLAFNVSSWPMSVVGAATRAIALPGFVEAQADDGASGHRGLRTGVASTAAVVLPIGFLLAALAGPLIEVLYGPRWLPAAAALSGLGVFGALRVVLDVVVSYLIASGATRAVLGVQVLWLAGLAPAMALGVAHFGLAGAGWVHPLVAVVVGVPLYGLALVRRRADPVRVLTGTAVPVAASVVVAIVAWLAAGLADRPWPALLLGGSAGVLCWVGLLGPWLARLVRMTRAAGDSAGAGVVAADSPASFGAVTAQVGTSSPDEGGGA